MRKFLLFLILALYLSTSLYAAPCYGTKMPGKNKFFVGLQYHAIFKRYLENGYGKLRSQQNFFLLSYGVFDWLSIDLKSGGGDIRQHPIESGEVDYPYNFAGGYGLRMKFYERENAKAVFGFQHISVHPKSINLATGKNSGILDDWQFSLLASLGFKKFTPYLGMRWSRVDYIHKIWDDRKRRMSDLTKDLGLIFGLDLPVTEKIWLNLEGSAFDSQAFSFSVNFKF
jgi:opacity protein-like surface antigen